MANPLRSILTPGNIRRLGRIVDTGKVLLGNVGDPQGGDASTRHDGFVSTWVRSAWRNIPRIAKLFAPGNMLWRLPDSDDPAMILVPANFDGPNVAYVLFGAGNPPSWLTTTKSGLYVSRSGEVLRLEATDGNVEVAASGSGKTVNINGSDHPLPKWDTFESDLSTLLNNIAIQLALGTAGSPVKQQLVGLAQIQADIAAFRAKLANATFESSKGKNG